ncbi:MAG: SMP-30/gluconolactonase/LRE family protein [Acidobacteria bacterium]|nr:SMP-30/gluconolactonase/LRE family protein [Acidobacteriota bacterium]
MHNPVPVQPFDEGKSASSQRQIIFMVALGVLVVAACITAFFICKKKPQLPTSRYAVGNVTVFAGAGFPGVQDGVRFEAAFSDPFGIAVDSQGYVIVTDAGASNRLRRITPQGMVETLAGSVEGFADGAATEAKFNTPSGLAIDADDNLIIADTSNNRIRKLDKTGQVTTLAGSGERGLKDGAANTATFDAPVGVALDQQGNVYVADTYNDCIRKIARDGQVTTLAGKGVAGYQDGQATEALFDTPCGIAVDQQGNVYVADTGNNAIRKITLQGEVTTYAKNDDDEQSREARLNQPIGLAFTHDGFLLVTNHHNGRVQVITPEGEVKFFAGSTAGFADGAGAAACLNGAAGIAMDQAGNLYVADANNYLIRKVAPVPAASIAATTDHNAELFIQPIETNADDGDANQNAANAVAALTTAPKGSMIPRLDKETLRANAPFLWPLQPQNQWHEVAGVVGEVRGWFNGEARDHLHSGLDIAGKMGEACLSIMDEKVSAPISTWGYNDSGEGIHIGLMSYIHIRVGRDMKDRIQIGEKFKPRLDAQGVMTGVRVRRGTRFNSGDFIGTLNRLYHVHMNLGPRHAEANAIQFPFVNFKDTIAPVIEANGIEILDANAQPFKAKAQGRLKITGDVMIVVTAYDRVDGNNQSRKLGLYQVGYQLLNANGTPVKGFEQPLINIEFNRLPATDEAVKLVYAEGSGISAYGTPTTFKYVVTNRVRDGEARRGLLRTALFTKGNYIVKVIAEDYAGNRVVGKATELAITIE